MCFNELTGDFMCCFVLGDLRMFESFGRGLLEYGDLDRDELCFLGLLLDYFFFVLCLDLLLLIFLFLFGSINENLY